MSYEMRNYRHRNPKTGGEEQKASTPFFNAPKGAHKRGVQRKKKGGAFFQPKLTIGQPGDIYEKEADAVASQVVSRQESNKPGLHDAGSGAIHRLATSKEDEKLGTHDARMEKDKEEPQKPVHLKEMPGEDKKKKMGIHKAEDPKKKKKMGIHKAEDPKKKKKMGIHKAADPKKKKKKGADMGKGGGMIHKKEADPGGVASAEVTAELERQSGKGSPLPARTLAEMNKSFGMDFSHVRIHTDHAAMQLCKDLNAHAFTHGRDIYFNEGRYNPESAEGRLLLAHELTHVAQQHDE